MSLKGEFPNELEGHKFHPDTLLTHAAYAPEWSEYSAVPPRFDTSTWLFASAEEAARVFAAMHGPDQNPEDTALAYSRINNPNVEILEKRLALLEGAEAGAVFASGMAAIATLCLAQVSAKERILHTEPLYGGTDSLIKRVLPRFGLLSMGFSILEEAEFPLQITSANEHEIRLVFIETPANPTNHLHDIGEIVRMVRSFKSGKDALVVVDNTFLSPCGQKPLEHGADAVVYSLTKSISGYGDVIGGAVLGSKPVIRMLKQMRSATGGIMSPDTAWRCMQHLGTLPMRIEAMTKNARRIAGFLFNHQKVDVVHFPTLPSNQQRAIYDKQCLNAGHVISFEVKGGQEAAFRVLDNLTIVGHAVSLGGIKSLACHPATTTHGGVSAQDKQVYGISDGLIRLSVGTEDRDDLVWDLERALSFA